MDFQKSSSEPLQNTTQEILVQHQIQKQIFDLSFPRAADWIRVNEAHFTLYSKSANSLPPRPPRKAPRKPRGAGKPPLPPARPLPPRKPMTPLPLQPPRPRLGRRGMPKVSAFSRRSSAQVGRRSLQHRTNRIAVKHLGREGEAPQSPRDEK